MMERERELDDVCANQTNGGSTHTKSEETVKDPSPQLGKTEPDESPRTCLNATREPTNLRRKNGGVESSPSSST